MQADAASTLDPEKAVALHETRNEEDGTAVERTSAKDDKGVVGEEQEEISGAGAAPHSFSKARLISLVIVVTGAAFLNV